MYKTILFIAFLLLGASLFGQVTFHKKLLGGGMLSTTPLNTGGALGVGYQNQWFAPNHGLVVRFNDQGEVLWRKRYPSLYFIWKSIQTDHGYLILGDSVETYGSSPHPRYFMVSKLAESGDVLWTKKAGNPLGQTLSSNILKVSGGYAFSGVYTPFNTPAGDQSCFFKLDDDGNTLWSKTYSANIPNTFNSFSAQHTEGDTLYACGQIQGNGCFVRINVNTGELLGYASLGGIYYEAFTSLKPTKDGNFMLAGTTRSTTGSEESRPWVVKVDRAGHIIWSKTYNLPNTSLSCQMAEADDGGFVLSMGGDNSTTTSYAVLAKIDASGNLLWAYNYSGGQASGLGEIQHAPDGGFFVLGADGLLKTDSLGHVSNGCCPEAITFQVENYTPPIQNPLLMAANWELALPFSMEVIADDAFEVKNFCETELTSLTQQISVCQGDSIQINGVFYQAPQVVRDTVQNLTGACDTVRVYNLLQIPQPFRVESIQFCPGDSVLVHGITYTQPDTISQILPATTGCDTLLVTFLNWKSLPKKYQTTTFCPGDTVFVDGVGYQFPGILPNPDTLPGAGIGCDTLLYQVLAYPSAPSSVSVQCPTDFVVSTAPATPIIVNYALPTATSNCTCPDLYFYLTQGLPPGAAFPIGSMQVCYSASDVCGDYKTCCFTVHVEEEEACDIKETGCIRYEILGVSADAGQHKTYRLRVTNNCASPLNYTAFQIPNGLIALTPVQLSSYISPNGRDYSVRNPNQSPFHSIRFKPMETGIASGQSDVFEYTLPAQASPNFIRAATRIASGQIYEATLNTFGCAIQGNAVANRAASQSVPAAFIQVFPNPSSGELFVDLSPWENGRAQLRILNTHGQALARTSLPTGVGTQSFQIPAALPSGLYFLEISAANGAWQMVKFVLRR